MLLWGSRLLVSSAGPKWDSFADNESGTSSSCQRYDSSQSARNASFYAHPLSSKSLDTTAADRTFTAVLFFAASPLSGDQPFIWLPVGKPSRSYTSRRGIPTRVVFSQSIGCFI